MALAGHWIALIVVAGLIILGAAIALGLIYGGVLVPDAAQHFTVSSVTTDASWTFDASGAYTLKTADEVATFLSSKQPDFEVVYIWQNSPYVNIGIVLGKNADGKYQFYIVQLTSQTYKKVLAYSVPGSASVTNALDITKFDGVFTTDGSDAGILNIDV